MTRSQSKTNYKYIKQLRNPTCMDSLKLNRAFSSKAVCIWSSNSQAIISINSEWHVEESSYNYIIQYFQYKSFLTYFYSANENYSIEIIIYSYYRMDQFLYFSLIFFLFGSLDAQQTCLSPCSSCDNNYTCITCLNSYVLVDERCLPCPQNCLQCTNNGLCIDCISSTQLVNGNCLKCSLNCVECTNIPTNCSTCRSHLILSNTNSCILNPSCPIWNCQACQNQVLGISSTPVVCLSCQTGYFVYNGICHPCPFPCSNCTQLLDWSKIQTYINQHLSTSFPNAPLANLSTYSSWQQENLFQVLKLQDMFDQLNLNASHSITQKLVTLGVLTANGVNPKRLSNNQKIKLLATSTPNGYTVDNIESLLFYYIQSDIISCHVCLSSYFLNNGTCNKCLIGCELCSHTDTCTQCQSGYALVSGICLTCTAPCSTCQNSTQHCTSCFKPYSLGSNNNCQICKAQSCNECKTSLDSCDSCLLPFSYYSNSGICFRCSQDQCLHCNFNNTIECFLCKPSFTLNSRNNCVNCPANCVACTLNQTTSTFKCWKCEQRYVLQNGNCNSCGVGCLQCSIFNSQACLACQQGFFINSQSICQECSGGCQICTDYYGVCQKYLSGITLYNNKTARCGASCKICNSNRPINCEKCFERFYLNSSKCFKCGQNCLQCISSTACTLCIQNTHLISNACKTCLGNCLTCSSTNLNSCTSCKYGYTINQTSNLCELACGYGCALCQQSDFGVSCIKCNYGYALKNDGTCVKCLVGCTGECFPEDVTKCRSCSPNFELSHNYLCVRCPSGCYSCINSLCTACINGYTLSRYNSCYQNCNFPCLTCSQSGCLSCLPGYKLLSTDCIFDDTTCNPLCTYCPPGSFLNSTSLCGTCSIGCSACIGPGVCTICFDGYYLFLGSCFQCPTKCKTCINGNSCIQCSKGYLRQMFQSQQSFASSAYYPNCSMCEPKCSSCYVSTNQCDQCITQYRLRGFKCFGRNNVRFKLSISISLMEFLSGAYSQPLLSNLANLLGIDKSNIILASITEGSTIIEGQISADTNSQAIGYADQIFNAINNNNNVLGFPISYKSIGAYYDDSEVYDSATLRGTPAVIIGCSIGAGVLIIGIIIVCCIYRKKKRDREQHEKYLQRKKADESSYKNEFKNYVYDNEIKQTYNYLENGACSKQQMNKPQ